MDSKATAGRIQMELSQSHVFGNKKGHSSYNEQAQCMDTTIEVSNLRSAILNAFKCLPLAATTATMFSPRIQERKSGDADEMQVRILAGTHDGLCNLHDIKRMTLLHPHASPYVASYRAPTESGTGC